MVKYNTPQIFIFYSDVFLMLQFRAESLSDIQFEECPVDCWIIPSENDGGMAIRYAFYRLIVQGFRRCQSMSELPVNLQGRCPDHCRFFSGAPLKNLNPEINSNLH